MGLGADTESLGTSTDVDCRNACRRVVHPNLSCPWAESPVGLCIGVNAAVISIVTEWLSDIKMGYCSDGWWLNQQFCCWEIEGEESDFGCDSWRPWSRVTLARWLIYVVFAVSHYVSIASQTLIAFKGNFFIHRGSSCQVTCEIFCRFWHLRNQVHSRGSYHERIPRVCDIPHKKCDVGELCLLGICLCT
jgi:hypothetical protein